MRILEIRITIKTKPIASVNNSLVRSVNKSGPGIDVANLDAGEGSALDEVADGLDVADEGVRVGAGEFLVGDASWGNAVEVLAADGDAGDDAG